MTELSQTSDLDVPARLRDPETLQDPCPFHAWLREHAPVHRYPAGGMYLVSRNKTARTVYQSPDLRALESEEPPAKHPRPEQSCAPRFLAQVMNSTNPPEHTRLMTGDVIGVAEADREAPASLILQVLASIHPTADDEVPEAGNRAGEQVEEYFARLAGERRARPREDLVSAPHTEVNEGEEKPERPVFRPALSLRTFERSPVAL
ncbi:hypothetical protein [Streptomyces jumonjinensis]|uniref:hypothetical protein n=1 Tax=Streptomyces jumonjinensis TaxID=1945 RepID=UPI003797D924